MSRARRRISKSSPRLIRAACLMVALAHATRSHDLVHRYMTELICELMGEQLS